LSEPQTLNDTAPEQAILVGVSLPGQTRSEVEETLEELALLADTAGATVLDRMLQDRSRVDPASYIGSGKVEELAELIKELGADLVIFDDDLSPAQLRNLEEPLGVKIVDRSRLILDIFSRRAKTREAQTQVELAQLQYMLPRLTRQWTHLSRQAGGGGASGGIGTRGPGETQLEVDRRAIRTRINSLSNALDRIARRRATSRKNRSGAFRVALVGYTNAGKSTLMQGLSGAEMFIEDRVFATLDPTTRSVSLGYNRTMLLTDTVGFIRKLPHHLVASFRSTLEEAVEADLLLHVVDVSHPAWEDQIAAVVQTLDSLGIADAPTLMVMNKSDRQEGAACRAEVHLQYPDAAWVSALTGDGLDDLRYAIYDRLEGTRVLLNLEVPQSKGKLLSELYRIGEVLSTSYSGNDVLLEIKMSKQDADRLVPPDLLRST
jgi:GTP-binding protein HflX